MALSLYKEKRNFNQTPEPAGEVKGAGKALRFVVQMHDASALHYDFRLELEDVLKSWAVPKGPSLRPADKRLAMAVEDHPYDYRNFEGVIPEGNYGAGTVIVWDEGTYEVYEGKGLPKNEQEQLLKAGLEKGNFKFALSGKKLKGTFTLMRMRKGGENAWLLIKNKDEYASDADVTEQDKSVKSGKTLAAVAAANGVTLNHPAAVPAVKQATRKKQAATTPAKVTKSVEADLLPSSIGRKAAMPKSLEPMLATLTDAPFDDAGWLFEIKWDGYRAIANKGKHGVELLSRNNKSFAQRYQVVTDALAALNVEAVFDGEIVTVNDEGLANFQALQNWQNTQQGHLRYYIFDLLWLNGKDLTKLSLAERKALLESVLPADDPVLVYSDHVVGEGKAFFEVAVEKGLEGIMAKKADSIYQPGARTDQWLKIKVNKRQEMVIAGFTQPRASRKFFGALLLGVYKGNELVYTGHTGSGFDRNSLEEIYNKLQPLVTPKSPFADPPKTNMPATWVKPQLVGEIKFTEWTREGHARHPIFLGLREDKPAKEVRMEASVDAPQPVERENEKGPAKKKRSEAADTTRARKKVVAETPVISPEDGEHQEVAIAGQTVSLTNLNKPYWKKEGFTKGDMLHYYSELMPFIFPYLKDRPQSLRRHPNGISSPGFFQKDVAGKVPEWMPMHEDFSESTGKPVHYLVCNHEAVLLYMANLGCIELHPWHSRVGQIEKPDYCLLDLDPHTGSTFDEVIETALVVKKVLDGAGADCYCKTSGSSGLHIYIPLGAKYTYDAAKSFAEQVVIKVQQELPAITSLERNPAKRKGKIYLDWLQNTLTQTAACAYSLRPKPGMPVSTPLHWDEVKKGLTLTTWNARNIMERLHTEGDLFAPVLGKGIDLDKAIKRMG